MGFEVGRVSVVVPAFDEEESLGELIERVCEACRSAGYDFELIVVDDGSTDASAEIIRCAAERHPEIRGILLNRNYGQHAAVIAGLKHCRGEVIVTLDADLQNPPEEVPRMVATIAEGYDVVASVRVPREDSAFRRLASAITNLLVQRSTGVLMHDYGCMLRAYRRPVVDAILACREHSTFVPVLANSFASRTTEIEVPHEPRRRGRSKYGLGKLIALEFDLLTTISTFPLRVLTVSGAALAATGVGLGVVLLVARLVYGSAWAAGGVFTLFAVLFLLLGAQLAGFGLLGEYVGRIYDDVRARPRFLVREVVGAERDNQGRAGAGPPPAQVRAASEGREP